MSKTGLEMTHKLNERSKDGYKAPLKLGYIDAIRDLNKILFWQPVKLTNDQQAVLQWLKDNHEDSENIVETIYDLHVETAPSGFKTCLMAAYEKLDKTQIAEVIQAFGEWVLTEGVE